MTLSMDRRAAYLERLGLDPGLETAVEPSLEHLRRLHVAHLEQVPFENLDIHLGRPIELDATRMVAKIVDERRGGFCYELNGAFAQLLASLGYSVSLIEGRVFNDGKPGRAFDHLCLLVDLDRRYLADVGFGDSFIEPLPFELDTDHHDRAGRFRITSVEAQWPEEQGTEEQGTEEQGTEEQWPEEQWLDLLRDNEPQYRFSSKPRSLGEFEPGCHHHQSAQETSFTKRPLSSRATRDGRRTLRGLELVETIDADRHTRTADAAELPELLSTRFGIVLDPSEIVQLAAATGRGAMLFDTAIGRCGVAWVEQRIVAVVLPEHRDDATLARAHGLVHGSVQETAGAGAPLFVQRGVDAMIDLLSGSRRSLDDVLVEFVGVSDFDRAAYAVARTIPAGEVMTYGAVAKRMGEPGGAQAVGGAMGRNPVPLIVPCHRVVASDGNLGGFSANGGAVTKRRLLEIEGAPIDRPLF